MTAGATTFEEVYGALRAVMLAAAPDMIVARDLPGDLQLRTPAVDAGTGEPGWFGTVTVRKSYVAYHLMPLYADPGLAGDISDALARRRQGKTCFNFKRSDPVLFAQVAELTRRCVGAAPV